MWTFYVVLCLPLHETIQCFSVFPGQQFCASEYLPHTNAWNDMLIVFTTYKQDMITQYCFNGNITLCCAFINAKLDFFLKLAFCQRKYLCRWRSRSPLPQPARSEGCSRQRHTRAKTETAPQAWESHSWSNDHWWHKSFRSPQRLYHSH